MKIGAIFELATKPTLPCVHNVRRCMGNVFKSISSTDLDDSILNQYTVSQTLASDLVNFNRPSV